MTHPEQSPGWEPASEEELRRLYQKTQDLLVNHGNCAFDPVAVDHGSYDGLKITDRGPGFSLLLELEKVETLSRRAKDTLQIGGPLVMVFWEAHYAPLITETQYKKLEYVEPFCDYNIPQTSDSPIANRYLIIRLKNHYGAESDRMSELRELEPEHFDDVVTKYRFETELGVNQMTRAECQVLEEIVDGLAKEAQSE